MEKIATFTERLEAIMKERHFRNIDLSIASGIEKSRIAHYRRGKCGPKFESAAVMAKALEVDPWWLLGYDVPKNIQRRTSLAEKFELLNEIGKEKAEEYIDDLLENDKYQSILFKMKR